MKEIKDDTDGGIYHDLGLEESILLKWPTTHGNLQIQCNPNQNINGIFHGTRTNNLKIHIKTQKNGNSQNNLEKEEQSWRNLTLWLHTILQSYSNQNSMVLVQKQIHRSMEQDIEPRNKLTNLWPIHLWQRRQEHKLEKDSLFNK